MLKGNLSDPRSFPMQMEDTPAGQSCRVETIWTILFPSNLSGFLYCFSAVAQHLLLSRVSEYLEVYLLNYSLCKCMKICSIPANDTISEVTGNLLGVDVKSV